MRTLHITVTNKVATYLQRDGAIVCGNSDYSVKFTFDSEWDGIANKVARFVWNGKYFDVEFTGDECAVPVITNADKVSVGVYAGALKTTTPASIPCEKSILCGTNKAQEAVIADYKDQEIIDAEKVAEAAKLAEQSATEAKQAAAEAKAAAEEIKAILNEYINEIDTLIGG